MLVQVHYKSGASPERVLLERLRRWRGKGTPGGIATVNCSLFGRGRLHHLDAVIWTPGGCIIVETEAFSHRQEGTLHVPLNGPWTIDGEPVSFAGPDSRTPLDQSRAHTAALQTWLADQGLGQRVVRGAVLLIPFGNAQIGVHQQWSDPTFSVLTGTDDAALRACVEAVSEPGNEGWTANDIAIVFRAMGLLKQLPSPQELLNEGFLGPVDPLLWQDTTPGRSTVTQAGGAPAPHTGTIRPSAGALAQQWAYSPWRIYPKVPGEPDLGRATLRVTLALGMLLSFAWVVWMACRLISAWTPL